MQTITKFYSFYKFINYIIIIIFYMLYTYILKSFVLNFVHTHCISKNKLFYIFIHILDVCINNLFIREMHRCANIFSECPFCVLWDRENPIAGLSFSAGIATAGQNGTENNDGVKEVYSRMKYERMLHWVLRTRPFTNRSLLMTVAHTIFVAYFRARRKWVLAQICSSLHIRIRYIYVRIDDSSRNAKKRKKMVHKL